MTTDTTRKLTEAERLSAAQHGMATAEDANDIRSSRWDDVEWVCCPWWDSCGADGCGDTIEPGAPVADEPAHPGPAGVTLGSL